MRKNEDTNVASAKASKVDSDKSYKDRDLTKYEDACSRRLVKLREICFEATNVNAFAHILSFLNNQEVVKLQAATGATYSGSNTVASAVCCPCAKDELVIANGRCLACNRAETLGFHKWIATADARELYGIDDISNVPHRKVLTTERGVYGYHPLFEYDDLERNAIQIFGSKKKWLEHVAPNALRRQKEAQAEQEYKTLFATFSSDFQSFTRSFCDGRMSKELLRERAARFDSVCENLTSRSVTHASLDYCHYAIAARFVVGNVGSAEQAQERRKREQEEAKAYLKTFPKKVADYLDYDPLEKSAIEARYVRYCELTAALNAKELELQPKNMFGSSLCSGYIAKGEGAIDDIVDRMEEMNFLYAHTSYSSECNSALNEIRDQRYMNAPDDDGYYWSDEYDDYGYAYEEFGYDWDVRERREDIKHRIKEQYLLNSQGLTLPANWQRERESRAAARQA